MSGGRHRFGGTQADRVFSYGIGGAVTRCPSATVVFYDSLTGGRRYTDLTTISGSPISSVMTDSNGEMGEFYGPSGIWKMAADVNAGAGSRRWINANDVGDSVPAWFNVQAPIFGAKGDGTTDDSPAITAAITAAEAAGGGVVYLPGADYYVTSALTVSSDSVWIIGDGHGLSRIVHNITGSPVTWSGPSGCVINFVGTLPRQASPLTTLAADALSAVDPKSSDPFMSTFTISVSTASCITSGDVLIIGDNYYYPYSNSGWDPRYRGEFCRVQSVSGTTVTLYGAIRNDYLVSRSAAVWKPTLIGGVGVRGLSITSAAGVQGNSWTGGVGFNACRDVLAEDLNIYALDEQAIALGYVYGAIVRGVRARDLTDSPANSRYGYGVNCGPCEAVVIEGCIANNVRHAVTTNGATGNVGWPRNILVSGCTAVDTTLCSFDTHPTASDVTFSGCKVQKSCDTGFQIRAERVRIVGCDVYMPATRGVYINLQDAQDWEIANCRFHHTGQQAIYFDGNSTDGYPDNGIIRDNYFTNTYHAAIEITVPVTNIVISGNVIRNPETSRGSGNRAITVGTGVALDGLQVLDNSVIGAERVIETTGSETNAIIVGNRSVGPPGSAPVTVYGGASFVSSNLIAANYVAGAVESLPNTPQPDDQGLIAWSAAPDSAANNTPLVSGTIYLVKVWLRQAQTIANILLSVGCAGSGLTPGQNLAALIDSNGNQRGTTADQAAAWASTGVQTMALTCPYNAAPGWYYVAILSAGTTPPSLQNCNANPGINAGLATTALRMAINGTSQTSIPASFTLSSNSTCGARLWWAAIS